MNVLNVPSGEVIQHSSAKEVAASLQRMILKYGFIVISILTHYIYYHFYIV